jgi:two-component system OmpR family response regulator
MSATATGQTIVIADDDAALVQMLRHRCEARGLRVRTAYDALAALNLVHEARPDVICLDVNMPSGNGLSVMEMILDEPGLSPTPVIMMTGVGGEEIIRRCHRYGAYYVEKCSDLWSRLEPLVRELTESSSPDSASTAVAGAEVRRNINEATPW